MRRQFELATDPWLGFIFCPAQGPVATHEEALAIDQRLMETVGETPQTLRDLSVSLNRQLASTKPKPKPRPPAAVPKRERERPVAWHVETTGPGPPGWAELARMLPPLARTCLSPKPTQLPA